MSENLLNSRTAVPVLAPKRQSWWPLLVLPAWVLASFLLARFIISLGVGLLLLVVPELAVTSAIFAAFAAALVYGLTLMMVLGFPRVMRHATTSRVTLGLGRLPLWRDIALAPAGAIIYFTLSGAIVALIRLVAPQLVDFTQTQNVGFSHLNYGYEYALAFLTLVVIAPIAEETLFRGYLYGKLRLYVWWLPAILITSAAFGLIHGQWNVGLDVFALSVVLCTLREITGSIWAGVLVHMLKNGFAFYVIFINPSLFSTLGIQ